MNKEKPEGEYGLMVLICVFAIAIPIQSNPIVKASLILSIALFFCFTTFINWYIRLSK